MSNAVGQVVRVTRTLDLTREQEILAKCRAGDWSQFGELVNRYRRLVWSAVSSVAAEDGMETDLVQEVFIRAYEKLHSYRGDSAFSSWLYCLARNHAISYIRRRGRRPQSVSIDESGRSGDGLHERLPSESKPDTGYAEAARRRALDRLLMDLPLEYREVVNLYYLGEYTYEGIAEVLELPINTVKTRLRRGKQRLVAMADNAGWR